MTDERLSDLDPAVRTRALAIETIEAAAWLDSFEALAAETRGALGVAVERRGGVTFARIAALEAPSFNRAMGIGVFAPADDAVIEGALRFFRGAGVEHFWLQVPPFAEPPSLPAMLAHRGLAPAERSWGKFVRGVAPAPVVSTDLRIEEVGPERADDFASAALAGFALPATLAQWVRALPGRPRWRTYVAYDGATPLATGAAYLDRGLAWLGFGATRPEARRRGAQSALLARRIADALAAGCHTLATETGTPDASGPGPSWRNIERVGFELLYVRPNYAPAP